MKSALLLEYDHTARTQAAAQLQALGYVVAHADSPQAALHTAQAIRFDAMLTCTDTNADDRRSLLGELARLAPGAPIALLLDDRRTPAPRVGRGVALLSRPLTQRSLRRSLRRAAAAALDATAPGPAAQERRHAPQRRLQPR
ncbi:hypothetical protein HH212_19850 [Massilia forsythiae]|uniref:Flagellar regulatory FleQ domain-containing protein n=1 Tax=Massilia forsythiae TaxID=2728020 RepID=A0A7Z2ZVE2_9BURK|nr:hypothetical protein [Massilia forsythiae]QJE01992.1 hypothetical protein HH212_19850 [Massilia forsythiae]